MKGCILLFPKKGDLGLTKNYLGITLTSIAAKIYNALLRNRIEPKIDNILRSNQNRNTKVKVRPPDGETEYFDIVAGVLQRDTLALYLFIICLDYVLWTSIDKNQRKWFRADKEKKQKVPRKNNYRRRLCRWHSDSGKCTRPSRNTTA